MVGERLAPRDSFAGHQLSTPEDALHRAYFNGEALWTYLTTPFLLAMDGVRIEETEPWQEGSETWRVHRAYFPGSIETHCLVQEFFFGEDIMLRRHDYSVSIAGSFGAAQLTSDYAGANGLRLPTNRRAYTRGPDRRLILEMLMVSIDISDVSFTYRSSAQAAGWIFPNNGVFPILKRRQIDSGLLSNIQYTSSIRMTWSTMTEFSDHRLSFDDLQIGQRFISRAYVVDEEQIKSFARQFDPQPFHLENEAAKNSLFSGLAASGWHTAAITMRLLVEGGLPLAGGVIGAGGQLDWPNPTRPGDTLQVESEVLEVRPSQSRPDRGVATVRSLTRNQRNEVVQRLTAKLIVARRV
jgi:acyl dehydratase